jgi:hypothetical protein
MKYLPACGVLADSDWLVDVVGSSDVASLPKNGIGIGKPTL